MHVHQATLDSTSAGPAHFRYGGQYVPLQLVCALLINTEKKKEEKKNKCSMQYTFCKGSERRENISRKREAKGKIIDR